MCGRYTLRTPASEVASYFLVPPAELPARFNIAPTQQVPAVRMAADGSQRELVRLRWGLVPAWSKEPKTSYSTINARAETVAEKPTYRTAFKKRRCLIVADGFYEWQKTDDKKQPYYIHMKDQQPFAFAGLWERWHRGEQSVESCTIIVTTANELMQPIHDRMPVILPAEAYDQWLDPEFEGQQQLQALLKPYPADEMAAYPVSTLVNSPRNDTPQCLEPVS